MNDILLRPTIDSPALPALIADTDDRTRMRFIGLPVVRAVCSD
jgi:hypothetical protein